MPYKDPEKQRAYDQAKHLANRERNNARSRAYRLAHLEERRAKDRAWAASHKEEQAAKSLKRRLDNPQKHKEQAHAQYLAHREKRALKSRRQREARPEHYATLNRIWHETHRPEKRLRARAWYKAHPSLAKYHARLRHTRKLGLPYIFTMADESFCRSYFHYACAVCGNQEGFQWTIAMDHWIPLAAAECPGTVVSNMIPLCHGIGGCNNSKRHREPRDWLVKRYGDRRAQAILAKIHAYFALVVSKK